MLSLSLLPAAQSRIVLLRPKCRGEEWLYSPRSEHASTVLFVMTFAGPALERGDSVDKKKEGKSAGVSLVPIFCAGLY